MKKLNILTGIFLLVVFTSCEKLKTEDNTIYTLSGHLYEDCSMTPVANKEIILYQIVEIDPFTSSSQGGELGTTTTDANGYFKFDYKDKKGGDMKIQYRAGAGYNPVMTEMPRQTTDESLVLYMYPATNIQVSLNVINPYTSDDTLTVTKLNSNQLKIPGPFTSGVLYNINFNMLGTTYDTTYTLKNVNYAEVGFKVNNGAWGGGRFSIRPCQTQQVTLTID